MMTGAERRGRCGPGHRAGMKGPRGGSDMPPGTPAARFGSRSHARRSSARDGLILERVSFVAVRRLSLGEPAHSRAEPSADSHSIELTPRDAFVIDTPLRSRRRLGRPARRAPRRRLARRAGRAGRPEPHVGRLAAAAPRRRRGRGLERRRVGRRHRHAGRRPRRGEDTVRAAVVAPARRPRAVVRRNRRRGVAGPHARRKHAPEVGRAASRDRRCARGLGAEHPRHRRRRAAAVAPGRRASRGRRPGGGAARSGGERPVRRGRRVRRDRGHHRARPAGQAPRSSRRRR
jgi:hypothetical protein